MKKLYFVFALSLFMGNSIAQEIIDSVAYRFVYEVQAKRYERSKKLSPDEHWLDIGKNGKNSRYYSKWKERALHLKDSIGKIGGNEEDAQKARFELSNEHSTFPYFVYKNYPSAGLQTVNYLSFENLQYQEPMGQDWQLAEGDTTILNHPCGKAVCHYHGKMWTAYYATDIPISEGPWKLCGLPGLIMRAFDESGSFVFNCVGILQHLDKQIVMHNILLRRLQPKQAHKLIEQLDSDPEGYYAAKGHPGKMKVVDQYGREQIVNFSFPKPAYYESYSTK